MLNALLGGRPRRWSGCASSCRPTTRGTRRWSASLLYGADATDEMVLAGRGDHARLDASGRSSRSCRPWATTTSARSSPRSRRVPVEIFVGDSDKLTPQRHSRQLAEALPDAELHEVERTGHMLTQERPQLVTDAIERLLAAATGDRAAA